MNSFLKNLSFSASLLGNYRYAHPLLRLMPKRYSNHVQGQETLVLEGFARSGNSFFHNALILSNPGINISHHTHLFCNISRGLALGIPCVVLIRDPGQTVSSMVVWDGKLKAKIVLLGWIHFYQQLIRQHDRCLVFRFEDAVGEPDKCIHRINEQFLLALNTHSFSDKQRHLINKNLSSLDKRIGRGGSNSSIPNRIKSRQKQRVLDVIEGSYLLEKAKSMYHKVLSNANTGVMF